ncbi:hypothetical protein DM860_004750 [Cuscuta australis]|uniref:C2H2-type domain-containing protein n=1 Tax=Cuscuta australis TaxID=267555 RepID=A0A328DQD6_9ASTE|nr:hypothetical protein DM860_004750 [Cuscuta australis]
MSQPNAGNSPSSAPNSPPPAAATTSPTKKRSREVGQTSGSGSAPPSPPSSRLAIAQPEHSAAVAVVVAPPPPPPAQPNTQCSVCQRRFQSRQALFGHMRLHSNRGWRGAFPPPVFNRSEFADVQHVMAAARGEDVAVGENAVTVALLPPPPAGNEAPARGGEAHVLPDLNEPHYRVPDLNFPPPPA